MPCKICKLKPVLTLNSGVKLCKSCFIRYFEKKVRKTIRDFKLLDKKDKVAVGVSGGKDSLTVLNILNNIAKKHRYLELVAILIDEGIKGYREFSTKDAKRVCEDLGVELKIYSFKEEFGYTLDQMVKKLKLKPCTVCGVFRRYLLNKKAKELKVKKLVTGHNLNDEAQAIIMNQFKSNMETSARLGPITGVIKSQHFVRRIKPLYQMSEKEVMVYAFLKGFVGKFVECPYASLAYRSEIRDMLNNFEQKHPGTQYSIISSFLDVLPLLKKAFKGKGKLRVCKVCGEPCAQDKCKACQFIEKLKRS